MNRTYKTELRPTAEQAQKIRRSMGVCRWLYNEFIATNVARHEQGLPFMSVYDFDKHINHDVNTQEAYA